MKRGGEENTPEGNIEERLRRPRGGGDPEAGRGEDDGAVTNTAGVPQLCRPRPRALISGGVTDLTGFTSLEHSLTRHRDSA
ncbi:hypothetical protein ROHU_018386 [Labeo rohita]|uniref:Uncharacterized protein n=1 Tax=Labeo rohita TaxID=84645 RepID=A0A498N933_LABRO|nr:hypothetical protein ROHU_018386 [Labeo rohita]